MTLEQLASAQLTVRERQVLVLLATDLDNKTIAEHLGVSRHTLQHHITSLYAKLGCSDRARAIVRGMHVGLIGSNEPRMVESARQSNVDAHVSRDAQSNNVVMLWVGDSLSRAWHAVSPSQFRHRRAQCGLVPDQRNGNPKIWERTCPACLNAIGPATAVGPKLARLARGWHVIAVSTSIRAHCRTPASSVFRRPCDLRRPCAWHMSMYE